MPAGYSSVFGTELDQTVHKYITLANEVRTRAIAYRSGFIKQPRRWDGSWPCGFFCNHHYAEGLTDMACASIFGLNKPGKLGSADVCCRKVNLNDVANPASKMYSDLVTAAFLDGFVESLFGSMPNLWPYMTTSHITNGVKPSTVYKLAVSPVENSNTQLSIDDNHFYSNYADYTMLKNQINSSARVQKIELTRGVYIIGIKFTFLLDRAVKTTTIGGFYRTPVLYNFYTNNECGWL